MRIFSIAFLTGFLFLTFTACGSGTLRSTTTGGTNSSVSTPTNAIVQEIGVANEQIYNDIVAESENLFVTRLQEIYSSAVGSDDTIEGQPTTFFLTKSKTRFAASEPQPGEFYDYNDVSVSTTPEDCANGGTKEINGTGNFNVDVLASSGTFTGTYNIVYSACEELVTISTADGSCVVPLILEGVIQHDFEIVFSRLVQTQDTQDVASQTTISFNADISTPNALEFTINGGATDNIGVLMDYSIASSSNRSDREGGIDFNGTLYDPEDVSEILTTLSSADVCP